MQGVNNEESDGVSVKIKRQKPQADGQKQTVLAAEMGATRWVKS